MTHSYTRTYATLTVSKECFNEIKRLLEEAGEGDRISLDMDGPLPPTIDVSDLRLVEHPGHCQQEISVPSEKEPNKGYFRPCGATLVRCRCGAKWCLDHQTNPLTCPQCGRRQ